ncbi:inositol hexakisphosphate-domain-containing protein [Radiomyces spectabilis]|uniref:inositol hexakisphosphate-domain-containing protein n=1 Tax=Radiomyces spectabilis TaxID=64574 RepID=UPI00221F72E2|nr:inositol hexakisphosphate-domain-containing protein [Radiomyces spectabilis]KAI8393383.1 inositol hexakisphosphate-domain-containing protein [Radiomyces spectabilis]
MVSHVLKTRSGHVLTRNTILKMDHFPRGMNTKLDFHLQGAPNFRVAGLNVYGVAQPTVIGLSSILALLNCHPKSLTQSSCTWYVFLTREEPLVYLNGYPYVLRDYADPMQNMGAFLGINSVRLEKVEERLKADVLKEASSMGGLLLVHQELSDGTVVPCYIAADTVQTPREVFRVFQAEGYRLKFFRIPISPEQAPEDNYFDEYVRVIKSLDPTDSLIFNCGMGGVRTTVGIIIAQIIRRTQLIERGCADPFPIPGYNSTALILDENSEEAQLAISPELMKGMEEADIASHQNHALLRLVYVLEKGLNSKMSPRSAIEWTLERSVMIENLKEAIMGNYQAIVALTSVLDSGIYSKKMLDEVIDRSDAVVNLREDILMYRIRHTTEPSSGYEGSNNVYLEKALNGLQRYFFLLCFTAYINESPDTRFETRFSSWVKSRTEIWTMLQHMRRKGPQLYLFRPVDDLRNLSTHGPLETRWSRHGALGFGRGMFEMVGAGAQTGIVPNEVEQFILKARTGIVLTSQTILKMDFWRRSHAQMHHTFFVEGASNFRRIKHTHVYGVAQPTVDGLRQVLRRLLTDRPQNEKVLWINLREEPIIYINGIPYVLRDRYFTLRNIRVYKGITGARLEQLEERLKEDVIREVMNYDGRILLHGENTEGDVQPVWEEVDVEDILTVREVMEMVAQEVSDDLSQDNHHQQDDILLDYHRVPLTAEKPPQWADFDELRHLIGNVDLSKTALILNCQIGLGRSTIGNVMMNIIYSTVIATLLTNWMRHSDPSRHSKAPESDKTVSTTKINYQIINSLLRVIKNGLETKSMVDQAIDQCGAYLNLREMIESAHIQADNETDDKKRKRALKRGIAALERYFLLICFQAYLNSTSPETMDETESFERWMKRHQEMECILLMFHADDESLLVPVEKSVGDGVALSSEVMRVVSARRGQVLAQQTILKHDAFPGCQKMSLKEKIEGAYNYRRVEVKKVKNTVKVAGLSANLSGLAADMERGDDDVPVPPFICGCAMPSKDAIKAVLKTMNAGPGGKRKVLWTCLREEPVLYVNKQPYVLRLFQDPLKNLETTGIAKERVESMEHRMKLDALEELEEYEGRLLLHDEEVTDKGGFTLLPMWETVPVECVETPSEVFQSIIDEGYMVDYLRIPITDEQAPIPDVFDQLIQRTLNANAGVDVVFNCQMGRGRTTTGMVTACLMSMVLKNDTITDMTGSFIIESPESTRADSSMGDREIDESHEQRLRYENGEYRIILQLISVLTYGKLAKQLTDQAINMCDHMQNLRKAIYDYKLRAESQDHGSKKWRATREVALNYLVRYFYLIVFGNYLLEEIGHAESSAEDIVSLESHTENDDDESIVGEEARKMTTFKEWLKGRREITNLIKLQSLELS